MSINYNNISASDIKPFSGYYMINGIKIVVEREEGYVSVFVPSNGMMAFSMPKKKFTVPINSVLSDAFSKCIEEILKSK